MPMSRLRIRECLAGLLVMAASGCGPVPVPGVLRPLLPDERTYTDASVCVVDLSARRGLSEIAARKDVRSGSLFILSGWRNQPLSMRYPATRAGGYAAEEPWYRRGEPIRQYGQRYVKYGPQRVVPMPALTRGADHRGVPVFLDRTDQQRPRVLYVPVAPGCVFQPYAAERYLAGG